MGNSNIQTLLLEGIAAAKAVQSKYGFQPKPTVKGMPATGDLQTQHARELLLRVTELDETNVTAWLWLSAVVDNIEDQYTCLNNVLSLDPTNQKARVGLTLLNQQLSTGDASSMLTTPQPPLQFAPQWFPDGPQAQGPSLCPFCHQSADIEDTICPHCTLPFVIECPACTAPTHAEWQTCANCNVEIGNYQFGAIYFTQLASAYKAHGRLLKAIEALRFAEMMMPDLPDLYRFIGEIQAELGHMDKAIATLQKAIDAEPDQAGPYLMLGKVLQKEEHYEDVEALYHTAIKAVPESSETHFALGDLLMTQNRFRRAWDHLQKAIHLDPDHGLAWIRVGQIYESHQKSASAIRAYKRAVALLEPDSKERQAVLERIKALQA